MSSIVGKRLARAFMQALSGTELKGKRMGISKTKEQRPLSGFLILGVSLALLCGVALLKARVR
jgi:hypothetical protein